MLIMPFKLWHSSVQNGNFNKRALTDLNDFKFEKNVTSTSLLTSPAFSHLAIGKVTFYIFMQPNK